MFWTVLGCVGIVLLVAGLGVLGWILAGTPGAAAGALMSAGVALLLVALDASSDVVPPEDA